MTAANRNRSVRREVANPLTDPIQAEGGAVRREALSTNIGSLRGPRNPAGGWADLPVGDYPGT